MTDQNQVFELNYLFEEKKNIFQSLNYVNSIYQTFYDFDQLVLRHTLKDFKVEYTLIDLDYSSFKTKVELLLKTLPDAIFREFELKELIGDLLIKLNFWLIQKLSEEREITTKEQIQEIAAKINKEINAIAKQQKLITTEVSDHSVLNVLSDISNKTNNLKSEEALQYKSKFGNALLKKGSHVNKPKILQELGKKNETIETTEIVKPKKNDLLSGESNWSCILNGKTVPIKILAKEWLDQYHNREFNIESGDSLKVRLRINYIYDPSKPKAKPTYEITEVEKIIKPHQINE